MFKGALAPEAMVPFSVCRFSGGKSSRREHDSLEVPGLPSLPLLACSLRADHSFPNEFT